MALMRVDGIKKVYPLGRTEVHALRGVSFEIERGDFLCIVGPSGCGKTTLLNIIGCIDRPTEGSVLLDEEDVTGLPDSREAEIRLRRMGFIFQSFNLIPVLDIIENVEFPMILAGASKKERRERARELVEAVGLSEHAKHKPDELSGGQRQRVAIARALVNRPELIIADEPTANLDSETGTMIVNLMKRLNAEQGTTFVFSTHNREIMEYAGRVIHMRDGRIEDVRRDGERQEERRGGSE